MNIHPMFVPYRQPPPLEVGPLVTSKTITIPLTPSWLQKDLPNPLRSATLKILFGPPDMTPETAPFSFEFNVFSEDISAKTTEPHDEKIDTRALIKDLRFPYEQYKNCVVLSGCKTEDPSLHFLSIALRSSKKTDLIWRNKRVGACKDHSYLKIFKDRPYFITLTFGSGSAIPQKMFYEAWRPQVYLCTREEIDGKDQSKIQIILNNLKPTWANGIEQLPDQIELEEALKSLTKEVEQDSVYAKEQELKKEKELQKANERIQNAEKDAALIREELKKIKDLLDKTEKETTYAKEQELQKAKDRAQKAEEEAIAVKKELKEIKDLLKTEKETLYEKERGLKREKDLAMKVEGGGEVFMQVMGELLNQKLDRQKKTFLETTLKRYALPQSFCATLLYGIYRIWNAVKTRIFGKSDWMIAHTIVKKAIESASWFQHLKNQQAHLLANSFMEERIKKK